MKTLKVYMAEQNIRSKQACKEIGCSESTFSKWLNNERPPSRKFIERIKEWSNGEVTADSFYS